MTGKRTFKPEGFHTATPYLIISNAAEAIEFYKKAFGAKELFRMADPDGRVRHAEIQIGDSPFMITDEGGAEFPDWQSPKTRGGTPVHIYLYVEDCDSLFKQAIDAGATELLPMKDQSYGDRSGGITDPYGHIWYISSKIGSTSEEGNRAASKAGE